MAQRRSNRAWVGLAPALAFALRCSCAVTDLTPRLSLSPQTSGRPLSPSADLFSSSALPLNPSPVVGVLSQPGDGMDLALPGKMTWPQSASEFPERTPGQGPWLGSGAGESYIAASYVKFAESGGARVVPVLYNRPWGEIKELLGSLNGILLPGGYANKSGLFLRRMRQILEAAIEFNRAGEYFPVLAECLSFEMLAMIISKEGRSVLDRYVATHPSTLTFAGEWAKQRNMFAWMAPDLVEKLETHNLTMENHKFGLSPSRLLADPDLAAFFSILTTTMGEAGKEYVSSAEAKEFPFTALQWHPEKNAYEWGNRFYPHSADAARVTSAAAAFFINEARKSRHKFRTRAALWDALIYNSSPIFSGRGGPGSYDQVYVFHCSNCTANICTGCH